MKKLLLLVSVLLPVFSFAQGITTKEALVSYYKERGYTVYNDYDFTMREGETKELDRYFYGAKNYVVLLVPTEAGVNGSHLIIKYPNSGRVLRRDPNSGRVLRRGSGRDNWEEVMFRLSYARTLTIKVSCYDAYYRRYDYGFSLVIMGR